MHDFYAKGYSVVPADDMAPLLEIRDAVAAKAGELAKADWSPGGPGPGRFLDTFHDRKISGGELNDFRLAMIRFLTDELRAERKVFQAFRDKLLALLGPDIAVQKTTNLVIQQPSDPDVVPTHRDAPLNSPFEIVVWLPLVDIRGTKGMYILDKAQTEHSLDILRQKDAGYKGYSEYAARHGANLEMPFGHACFFWPGLVHGCHLNGEGETRWSLNIRYKNIFSPYGSKGLPDFFEIMEISPLSRLAFESEMRDHG